MENKDAIAILAANVMFACDKAQFSEACKASVEDALTMAISALEKQAGKKAKKEPRPVLDYCYYCPTCNNYFGGTFEGEWRTGKPYYHCPECGQKIDWEG